VKQQGIMMQTQILLSEPQDKLCVRSNPNSEAQMRVCKYLAHFTPDLMNKYIKCTRTKVEQTRVAIVSHTCHWIVHITDAQINFLRINDF